MPFNQPLLGIDVSQNAVRLIALSKKFNKYQIDAAAIAPLKKPGDDSETIIAALRQGLRSTGLKTSAVVLDLAYSAVIHKTIVIPKVLSAAAITEFLNLNLEKQLGLAPAQVSFDYSIEYHDNTTINLIAVRKERIEKCRTILAAVNLKPKIIDIDAFALARAVKAIYRPTQPIAAMHIDYGSVLTCALDADNILYAHKNFIADETLKEQLTLQTAHNLQLCTTSCQPTQLILSGEHLLNCNLSALSLNLPATPIALFADVLFAPSVDPQFINDNAAALTLAFGLALRRFDAKH